MGDNRMRLAIGILGNAASLLLYAAPIFTIKRVIRKRSTEEFSCVPYILALMNCLIYSWYGLPIISNKWENFPLVTINVLGAVLEISFILIYFHFASVKGKVGALIYTVITVFYFKKKRVSICCHFIQKKVVLIATSVILIVCGTIVVSAFAYHDHRERKFVVGGIGLIASVAMYGSPLVVMKQVIQTKSVEFMPFYLSFFSLMASILWMVYGLLGHDLFLASPNLVSSPLGVFQLVLYCIYRKKGIIEEPVPADLEKNEEILKVQQLAVISSTNGKS